MARLIWSSRSEADLQSIYVHVSRDSVRAADELTDRIVAAAARLSDFPLSGRVVPEFNLEDIREVIVGNYRVVYQVIGDTVGIALVHHGARRLREAQLKQS